MRDNFWLETRLYYIWHKYFYDIPQKNEVNICFGRRSKFRFGLIRLNLDNGSTEIRINSLFKEKQISMKLVDHTIAHELVHYACGFSSPHPRLHKYPHRGGLIDKELKKRGLGHLITFYKSWVEGYLKTLR